MSEVERYKGRPRWTGSTAAGPVGYSREHKGVAPPATAELRLTSGDPGKGDPAVLNPEQLVVLAASSCQLLWFLHLAAKARIDVVSYEDDCEAEMPRDQKPVRLSRIVLRPRITVASESTEERVRHLCELAHRECYIANSLNTDVHVEPIVDFASG